MYVKNESMLKAVLEKLHFSFNIFYNLLSSKLSIAFIFLGSTS